MEGGTNNLCELLYKPVTFGGGFASQVKDSTEYPHEDGRSLAYWKYYQRIEGNRCIVSQIECCKYRDATEERRCILPPWISVTDADEIVNRYMGVFESDVPETHLWEYKCKGEARRIHDEVCNADEKVQSIATFGPSSTFAFWNPKDYTSGCVVSTEGVYDEVFGEPPGPEDGTEADELSNALIPTTRRRRRMIDILSHPDYSEHIHIRPFVWDSIPHHKMGHEMRKFRNSNLRVHDEHIERAHRWLAENVDPSLAATTAAAPASDVEESSCKTNAKYGGVFRDSRGEVDFGGSVSSAQCWKRAEVYSKYCAKDADIDNPESAQPVLALFVPLGVTMQYPLPDCVCDQVGKRYDPSSGLAYCSRLRNFKEDWSCERLGEDPLYYKKAGDILCNDVKGNCMKRYKLAPNADSESDNVISQIDTQSQEGYQCWITQQMCGVDSTYTNRVYVMTDYTNEEDHHDCLAEAELQHVRCQQSQPFDQWPHRAYENGLNVTLIKGEAFIYNTDFRTHAVWKVGGAFIDESVYPPYLDTGTTWIDGLLQDQATNNTVNLTDYTMFHANMSYLPLIKPRWQTFSALDATTRIYISNITLPTQMEELPTAVNTGWNAQTTREYRTLSGELTGVYGMIRSISVWWRGPDATKLNLALYRGKSTGGKRIAYTSTYTNPGTQTNQTLDGHWENFEFDTYYKINSGEIYTLQVYPDPPRPGEVAKNNGELAYVFSDPYKIGESDQTWDLMFKTYVEGIDTEIADAMVLQDLYVVPMFAYVFACMLGLLGVMLITGAYWKWTRKRTIGKGLDPGCPVPYWSLCFPCKKKMDDRAYDDMFDEMADKVRKSVTELEGLTDSNSDSLSQAHIVD